MALGRLLWLSRRRLHLRCSEQAPPPSQEEGEVPTPSQPTPPQPSVRAATPPISLGSPARQTQSPTGSNGLQPQLPPKKTPAWTPSSPPSPDFLQKSRLTTSRERTNSILISNTLSPLVTAHTRASSDLKLGYAPSTRSPPPLPQSPPHLQRVALPKQHHTSRPQSPLAHLLSPSSRRLRARRQRSPPHRPRRRRHTMCHLPPPPLCLPHLPPRRGRLPTENAASSSEETAPSLPIPRSPLGTALTLVSRPPLFNALSVGQTTTSHLSPWKR